MMMPFYLLRDSREQTNTNHWELKIEHVVLIIVQHIYINDPSICFTVCCTLNIMAQSHCLGSCHELKP